MPGPGLVPPNILPDSAQGAKDLRPIEPLTLAMLAVAHFVTRLRRVEGPSTKSLRPLALDFNIRRPRRTPSERVAEVRTQANDVRSAPPRKGDDSRQP